MRSLPPEQQSRFSEPVVAVVVAAGSGSRLGASVPKALVPLDGVALVRRAAEALRAGGVGEMVVTSPDGLEAEFAVALDGLGVRIVRGGATRQDSVRIGLAALTADDAAVVLVHDAARALVPPAVVRTVADAVAAGAGVAVPVLAVTDSVRRVDDGFSEVVDRASLRAVQTPQGARLSALRRAHEQVAADGLEVTDDAAVCEHVGLDVVLVPGHRDNLKITEPFDLMVAGALLRERGL